MKLKMVLIFVLVLFATTVLAVDPTTPPGYTPWFSVDIVGMTPDEMSLASPPASFPDWSALTLVVAASGVIDASPISDPSDEYLVMPVGSTKPGNWSGPAINKDGDGWTIQFLKSEGSVTKYTVYQKTRPAFTGCSKPGKPVISN